MWFFIRITTDNTTKEELAELFGQPYIISKEYSRRMKLHYHILWSTDLNKTQIQEKVYNAFPDEPRGVQTLKVDELQETFSDLQRAGSYTVKDGDFIYSEFFNDKIEEIIVNSFKKTKPYTTALKELIEQHTSKEYEKINWLRLKIDIAILRSEYHLEVYKSKIEALVLSVQISMNHNVAEELFE